MKKELRLRKKSDFHRVFKEGRRFVGPQFVLYALEKPSGNARLGISISKTHFKLATERNRLKRIAREVFRKELSPRLSARDIVITSRRRDTSLNQTGIKKEIRELFLKAQSKKC